MAKVKEKFVKVTVTGYIKTPDLTSAAACKESEGRLNTIKAVAKDQMLDVEVWLGQDTRHVEPETPARVAHNEEE